MKRAFTAVVLVAVLGMASFVCVGVLASHSSSAVSPAQASVSGPVQQLRIRDHYLGVITPGSAAGSGLTSFENATKVKPTLVAFFEPFGDPFNAVAAARIINKGAFPLLQINSRTVSPAAIAAGHYSKYLAQFAGAVRQLHRQIGISYGHEMNGPWYPWGYTHVKAATFVKAWQVIHHDFAKAGAYNVTWVWTVNRSGGTSADPDPWWPGKQYVNWVGVDGHYIKKNDSFKVVFAPTIRQIRKVTSDPVLIAETGIRISPQQPAQIKNLLNNARGPGMLGVVWFNLKARYSWRMQGNVAGDRAYYDAAQPYLKS